MRIVSLVPSITDALDHLGVGDQIVGVTRYCTDGAPETAALLGGTKNPDIAGVVAMEPDLVVVNAEENRPADIQALRDAGLEVEQTYPRSVGDAAVMMRRLGSVVGRPTEGERVADAIDAAIGRAVSAAPTTRVMALTLVWRRPWMGLGPDTYASDLLWTCGFGNVLSGFDDPYPTLDPSFVLGPDVVLLPSEPYAFSHDDLPAVAGLAGADTPARLVDGQALTWHGPRTAAALDRFSALAGELATAPIRRPAGSP